MTRPLALEESVRVVARKHERERDEGEEYIWSERAGDPKVVIMTLGPGRALDPGVPVMSLSHLL